MKRAGYAVVPRLRGLLAISTDPYPANLLQQASLGVCNAVLFLRVYRSICDPPCDERSSLSGGQSRHPIGFCSPWGLKSGWLWVLGVYFQDGFRQALPSDSHTVCCVLTNLCFCAGRWGCMFFRPRPTSLLSGWTGWRQPL